MFTKKKKQVLALTNLALIFLIILAALGAASSAQAQALAGRPGQAKMPIATEPPVFTTTPEPASVATASTAQDALNTIFEQYAKTVPPTEGNQWVLLETHLQDDWAYATAQQSNQKTGEASEAYAVLLAGKNPAMSWYALAPVISDPKEYNSLLKSFPTTLIDESTKSLLWLPETTGRLAVTSNFSGHRLPFPAGVQGYVPYKEGSGHTNQVDFTLPGETIYASKPGKVVFLKESSNTNCTTPPPDACWQNANMVVIQHSASEYSWYLHVAYNSVPVNVGSYVEFGTKLGVQSWVGYTSPANFSHLHYMVSNSVPASWPNPDPGVAPWPPAGSIQPIDFDETTWANLTVGNNYTSQNTSDPSAVAWGQGREDLFVQGENTALYHKAYSNGSWGSWENLGGTLTSAPDAASWGTGHLDVYVRGLDNNLYYRRYLNGAWADWLSAGAPPGGAMSNPSAVSTAANRIDLFVRGTDNALWHRLYSNSSWGNWGPLGGVLTTGPDAASPGNGQIQVFLAGVNKVMWRCAYISGACSWDQVPGGATSYDQGAVSPSTNRVDLFARGTDGQLFHRAWNGSAWGNWEPLGGFLTSGPDASSWRVNNHLDVFLRGSDNTVYHRWQNGGGWSGWESLGKP